mgnify:CR=1 FL=1
MASRVVMAVLKLDGVEGVITGFKKAGSAAVEYGKVAQKSGTTATRWVTKHADDVDRASTMLLGFGAVGALALGGMAKSAIDWESSWAGVTKTVDGSAEQLDSLQQGLRDMARELPASHAEIAAVAEAAGQLGVGIDDIEAFTRVMIDLGETTNLSAEEASTSLAQLMNVMGTSSDDVDNLGSTIVALGNAGASTERDIVAMAQRIAAAGNAAGLSEQDVLAFASALSSVGVEAEAGGTAISKTFRQIDAATREGGKSLDLIAKTAGMTASEFRSAWQKDAAGAVTSFVEGLGGMQARGEDVNGVLKDLNMTGERQGDVLGRLAGATKAAGTEQDLLRESLALAGEAWDDNSALAAEAEKRYQTTAAQAQIALNVIKDEAIDLGNVLLPVVSGILGTITGLADAFGGLPGPAKNVAVAILGISTMAALTAGGVGKLVVGINNAVIAFRALGIAGRTAGLALGAVGAALAVAGIFVGNYASKQANAAEKVRGYTAAIKEQGDVIGDTSREIAAAALADAGVLDLAEKYGANLSDVTEAALGSADALARVRGQIEGNTGAIRAQVAANEADIAAMSTKANLTDDERVALTGLISENERLNGELSNRVSGADKLETAITSEREAVEKATDAAKQMEEATSDGTEAAEKSAAAAQVDAEAKQELADAMSNAEQEQRDLLAATQAYGNALLQLSGSQIGVESAIAGVTDSLEENGKTLDITTEKGRDNQSALDDLAASSMAYVGTLEEQGASSTEIADATSRARAEWVKGAIAMGMSEEKAGDLADAYFAIPEEVTTTVATPGARNSQKEAEDLNRKLDGLPDSVRSDIIAVFDKSGSAAAEAALAALSRDRTVLIKTILQKPSTVITADMRASNPYYLNRATGGLVDFYGRGGVRDVANRHVAEIAPAGAMRVFAEPETEGEAYIPFRKDTRQRSLSIWRETGRRLGAYHYAEGAVVTSAPAAASVTGGALTLSPADISRIADAVRFGASAGTREGIAERDSMQAHAIGRRR